MGTNKAEELAVFWYNKYGKLSPKVVEINAFIAGYNSRRSEIDELTKEVERLKVLNKRLFTLWESLYSPNKLII